MNRSKMINFRVSDEEKAILEKKAEKNGMTVGNYLRTLGLYSNKIEVETKLKHFDNDE